MLKKATSETSVEIPEGIEVSVTGTSIAVKKGGKEIRKQFNNSLLSLKKKDNQLSISITPANKKNNSMIKTVAAHVKNMIEGVTTGYEYKLSAAYSHFPMNIQVKENIVEINNFVGEKKPRIAKIAGNDTKVVVKGKEITVTGSSKEDVGQTAANMETATRLRRKDQRIFQDGIYIVKKGLIEEQ